MSKEHHQCVRGCRGHEHCPEPHGVLSHFKPKVQTRKPTTGHTNYPTRLRGHSTLGEHADTRDKGESLALSVCGRTFIQPVVITAGARLVCPQPRLSLACGPNSASLTPAPRMAGARGSPWPVCRSLYSLQLVLPPPATEEAAANHLCMATAGCRHRAAQRLAQTSSSTLSCPQQDFRYILAQLSFLSFAAQHRNSRKTFAKESAPMLQIFPGSLYSPVKSDRFLGGR